MSAYREPLHRQVENILKNQIGDVYLPGSRIPTEKELAEEFEVSLQTVRRALADLVRAGLLVRRRGKGSYVNEQISQSPVALVCSQDLSTAADPKPALRMLSALQNELIEIGREYRIYLGYQSTGYGAENRGHAVFEQDWKQLDFDAVIWVGAPSKKQHKQIEAIRSISREFTPELYEKPNEIFEEVKKIVSALRTGKSS